MPIEILDSSPPPDLWTFNPTSVMPLELGGAHGVTIHACAFCSDTDHDYITPTLLKDGKRHRFTLCYGCAEENNHNVSVCPTCMEVDVDNITSEMENMCMTWCHCSEHAAYDDSPKAKCTHCGLKCGLDHSEVRWSMRGNPYCPTCWASTVYCGAEYCQTRIHPDEDGIVTSANGTRCYCSDCALFRKPPNGIGVHPLTWQYNAECGCVMCDYLAGRHSRWPVPLDMPERDKYCCNCGHEVAMAVSPSEGQYYCHCCSGHLKKCESCNLHKIKADFNSHALGLTMRQDHFNSALSPCNDCFEARTDLVWYCDIGCKVWLPLTVSECSCGGVHPYDYTPTSLNFMTGLREDAVKIQNTPRVWGVPFMGLELEIEAQKPGASKAKGANMTRDMLGDIGWCMHDGSLLGHKSNGTGGDMGFEFVTHPFTYEWFNENWHRFEEYLKVLSAKGYRSWHGGRCGMHIHISRAAMTDAHQMKFIRMVLGSTNLMMAVGQRGYRDKNLSKFAPFHADERSRLMEKVRSFQNPGVSGHYTALNTMRPSTIEARWFRGTLNPLGIRKNVELIHSMWYFTREYGFTSANEMNYITWLRQPWGARRYGTLLNFIEHNYITRR